MADPSKDTEKKIAGLKDQVEKEVGKTVETKVTDKTAKPEVKAEKAGAKAAKAEKKDQTKLADIVKDLKIAGLDVKKARRILRKECPGDKAKKTSWAWEKKEDVEKVKGILTKATEVKPEVKKAEKPRVENKPKVPAKK